MKNYALFAGEHYYPNGGFDDLKGFFDTREQAIVYAVSNNEFGTNRFEWYHIVDTRTFTVVIKGQC